MPSISQLEATVKESTGQVSTLTRSLALGYLAVCWALLTAHDEPLHSMAANVNRYYVLALAACSVLFLTCDLFQYFATARSAEEAVSRAKAVNPAQADLNQKSFAYRSQVVMFFSKFVLAVLGGLLLIAIFVCLLLPIETHPSPAATPAHDPCAATSNLPAK